MNASQELAASATGSFLWIIAGVLVVALLVGAFAFGSRRTARTSRTGLPDPDSRAGEGQRRDTWQTIDDDPDQGSPRP